MSNDPPLGTQKHPVALAAIKAARIPGWFPWIFKTVPRGVLCTGSVCPTVTKGPRKGLPNYRKADPTTRRQILVTPSMLARARRACNSAATAAPSA